MLYRSTKLGERLLLRDDRAPISLISMTTWVRMSSIEQVSFLIIRSDDLYLKRHLLSKAIRIPSVKVSMLRIDTSYSNDTVMRPESPSSVRVMIDKCWPRLLLGVVLFDEIHVVSHHWWNYRIESHSTFHGKCINTRFYPSSSIASRWSCNANYTPAPAGGALYSAS